jgi:hypothetical protein
MNFVVTLQEAYEPDMLETIDISVGGAALGVALTPQKRGLPPPPKGRGRRLPFWTAARSRPKIFLGLPLSSCMQILDTRRVILETWIGMRTINLAVGGAPRARARAMVRVGMDAAGRGRGTSSVAAAAAPSRWSAATELNLCGACAATLARCRLAAVRHYIVFHLTIANGGHILKTGDADDLITILIYVLASILSTKGQDRLTKSAEVTLEAEDWTSAKGDPVTARSGRAPSS